MKSLKICQWLFVALFLSYSHQVDATGIQIEEDSYGHIVVVGSKGNALIVLVETENSEILNRLEEFPEDNSFYDGIEKHLKCMSKNLLAEKPAKNDFDDIGMFFKVIVGLGKTVVRKWKSRRELTQL